MTTSSINIPVFLKINWYFFAAVAYFLSIKIALYSMITYLAASKTLYFIVEGGGMIRKRPLEQ
ncbi:hypothetical protein FPS14_contig00018-0001 [Flavobacterium psychrophilum]|nr:hypothetical protein FPS14_contig00018-0001 [Flavobacterium psychrophilum]